MRRLGTAVVAEAAVVGVLWAAVVLGVAVIILTMPAYTSVASQALGIPETAGLPPQDVTALSEQVRALVADRDYEPLPRAWKGEPAFDPAAVSHLMDVRSVIAGSRSAVAWIALVLAAYIWWCVARQRLESLARSMRSGALVLAVCTALALVVAVTSFDVLFTAFHGVFFAAGTWVFPEDSLLIRLFPERFWIASGAAWAALVFAGAAVLAVIARLLRGKLVRGNASRSANYV